MYACDSHFLKDYVRKISGNYGKCKNDNEENGVAPKEARGKAKASLKLPVIDVSVSIVVCDCFKACDILIFGKDQKEHDTRLTAALEKIQAAGVTLNKDKCEFNKTSLTFLGHTIDG